MDYGEDEEEEETMECDFLMIQHVHEEEGEERVMVREGVEDRFWEGPKGPERVEPTERCCVEPKREWEEQKVQAWAGLRELRTENHRHHHHQ